MSIRGYLEDSNKKHFSMNVIENDFIKFYCLFSDITDKFVEKDYVKLCKERNIEPMSEIEKLLICSPLMQIGTRFLLKDLKDFRNGGE